MSTPFIRPIPSHFEVPQAYRSPFFGDASKWGPGVCPPGSSDDEKDWRPPAQRLYFTSTHRLALTYYKLLGLRSLPPFSGRQWLIVDADTDPGVLAFFLAHGEAAPGTDWPWVYVPEGAALLKLPLTYFDLSYWEPRGEMLREVKMRRGEARVTQGKDHVKANGLLTPAVSPVQHSLSSFAPPLRSPITFPHLSDIPRTVKLPTPSPTYTEKDKADLEALHTDSISASSSSTTPGPLAPTIGPEACIAADSHEKAVGESLAAGAEESASGAPAILIDPPLDLIGFKIEMDRAKSARLLNRITDLEVYLDRQIAKHKRSFTALKEGGVAEWRRCLRRS